jgi:hypothetical protein
MYTLGEYEAEVRQFVEDELLTEEEAAGKIEAARRGELPHVKVD